MIFGTTIGVITGYTRSLDYSPCGVARRALALNSAFLSACAWGLLGFLVYVGLEYCIVFMRRHPLKRISKGMEKQMEATTVFGDEGLALKNLSPRHRGRLKDDLIATHFAARLPGGQGLLG